MAIVVCVKQVPFNMAENLDYSGKIERRQGVYRTNPLDMNALEAAIRLKNIIHDKIWVISMGTKRASETLKECIAMGADEAILLNDDCFAGSDTQATAYILSKAIKRIENVKAIFCGEYSSDSSTGHIGPELSEKLNFKLISNLFAFDFSLNGHIGYKRYTDNGTAYGEIGFPSIFTVNRIDGGCRVATIKGIFKADAYKPIVWDSKQIGAEVQKCGVNGSFTKIVRIENNNIQRTGQFWIEDEISGISSKILSETACVLNKAMGSQLMKDEKEELQPIIYKKENFDLFQEKETNEILIFAEIKNNKIEDSAFQLTYTFNSRNKEKQHISFVLIADNIPLNARIAPLYGVDKIYIIDYEMECPGNEHICTEMIYKFVLKICPRVVLFSATELGRNLAAMLASKLNVGLTADCTDLDYDKKQSILQQIRPVFGGNKLATIISVGCVIQMATVRPNIFPLRQTTDVMETVAVMLEGYKTTLAKNHETIVSFDKHTLPSAPVVFIGGRGLHSKSNFQKLRELAASYNVEVGATRVAVDLGWADQKEQIGSTGNSLTADLCILFGVSGALEHISGLMNVKRIIAINNDSMAAVFKYADICITTDAIKVIHQMEIDLNR